MYGRSPQRIGQILATRHPEHEDETSRALHRGRLELLITQIQQVIEEPGYKLTPNGHMAEDDEGNPLVDTSARTEAFKVLLTALDSARKLDGLDKPVKKIFQLERSEAEMRMWAAVEGERQRIAEAGKKPAVPGEVISVRELPSA